METVDPYTISIDLITKGDFTTKPYDPIPFEPNMLIDSTAPNQPKSVRQIYFAPMVELQKSDFAELEANTSYNSSSFMVDVLTNPTKFAALLRIARSNRDTLTYDNIIEQTPEFTAVVNKNLELLKESFFPRNATLFFLGKKFIVTNSFVRFKEFQPSARKPSDIIPLKYFATMEITLVTPDAETGQAPSGQSCNEKARELDDMAQQFFGINKITGNKMKKLLSSTQQRYVVAKLSKRALNWETRNNPRKLANRSIPTQEEQTEEKNILELDKLSEQKETIDKQWLASTADLRMDIKNLKEMQSNKNEELKQYQTEDVTDEYNKTFIQMISNKLNNVTRDLAGKEKQLASINAAFQPNVQSLDEQIKTLMADLTMYNNQLLTLTGSEQVSVEALKNKTLQNIKALNNERAKLISKSGPASWQKILLQIDEKETELKNTRRGANIYDKAILENNIKLLLKQIANLKDDIENQKKYREKTYEPTARQNILQTIEGLESKQRTAEVNLEKLQQELAAFTNTAKKRGGSGKRKKMRRSATRRSARSKQRVTRKKRTISRSKTRRSKTRRSARSKQRTISRSATRRSATRRSATRHFRI